MVHLCHDVYFRFFMNIQGPIPSLHAHLEGLAKAHQVKTVRTPQDALAEVITRLAGDEVTSDATEDLIVNLKRSGVINGAQMISFLGQHIDERKHVRSI